MNKDMLSKEQKELVEDNIHLVYFILHKYHFHHDLLSDGFFGLCKAAKTFDGSKGFTFSSYASTCIYNAFLFGYRKWKLKTMRDIPESTIVLCDDRNVEHTLFELTPSKTSVYDNSTWRLFLEDYQNFINTLEGRDKLILSNFLENKTQKQTARQLRLSQAHVSRRFKELNRQFISEYYEGVNFDDLYNDIFQS